MRKLVEINYLIGMSLKNAIVCYDCKEDYKNGKQV